MLKYNNKELKNKDVEIISIITWLGNEYKNKSWRDNEKFVHKQLEKSEVSIPLMIECPIDDLIYFQNDFDGKTDEGYYVKTKRDLELLKDTYEKIKNIFGNAEVSIHSNYIYDKGNECGFSIEEFLNMYTLDEEFNN